MKERYELQKKYMVRMPVHTTSLISRYRNIEEEYENIKNDNIFMEQLLVASRSLYDMVRTNNINDLTNKKKQQLIFSMSSYLNRASYRPTPFGLFSGVTIKNVDEDMVSGVKKFKKHCRIDLEWLLELQKKIECEAYTLLDFKLNNAFYTSGDRAYLLYNTGSNEGKVSIHLSRPFDLLREFCSQKVVPFTEIIDFFTSNYPNRDKDTFFLYIANLVKKEFLISDLRASICNTDELGYMIQKLEKHTELFEMTNKLVRLKAMIAFYERTEIGRGSDLYIDICKLMDEILGSKKANYLQIDTEVHNVPNIMGNVKRKSIEEFVQMLFKLTALENQNNELEEYGIKFIEKYGEYLEVPITELMDETLGIGAPKSYKNPANKSYSSLLETGDNLKVKGKFLDLYAKAVKTGEVIELDEEIVESIAGDSVAMGLYPDSAEISFIVKENAGKQTLYLGPNLGSVSAGKMFGRFGHMSDEYDVLLDELGDSEPDICEISMIPKNIRIGNVIRNKTKYKMNMCLYTNSFDEKNEVALNNILVGYHENRFYFRNAQDNKILCFTMTNMLNVTTLPNVVRFMVDASRNTNTTFMSLPWVKYYQDFSFIPEIRFKDIIISNAKWRISLETLGVSKKCKYEEFKERFAQYKEKMAVVDAVYYTLADNRLLFELSQDGDLKLLFDYLKKRGFVELEAVERGENVFWDEDESRVAEVVFPLKFIRNQDEKSVPEELLRTPVSKQIRYEPFDKWLYLKFYCSSERQDELIKCLGYFLKEQGVLSFYFMRYVDPKPHIRLRIKGSSELLFCLLSDLKVFCKQLQEMKLYDRYYIDTYIPEVERYGGLKLMELAEEIFCADSKVVIEILDKYSLRDSEKEILGIASILHYIKSFGLTFEEQLGFLEATFVNSKYQKEFNEKKAEYSKLLDSYANWNEFTRKAEYAQFLSICDSRIPAIQKYCKKLRTSPSKTNTVLDMVGSIIHLHCNRLYGTDRVFEERLNNLAYRILKSQKFYAERVESIGGKAKKERQMAY